MARTESPLRVLRAVFEFAVLASIVHYGDNFIATDQYPRSRTVPNPSPESVLAVWAAFTAAGTAGYVLFRRGRVRGACAGLALYSGSGLIGLGHYAAGGTSALEWWRHAHIVADIASGVGMLAFVVWVVLSRSDS